MSNFDRAGRWRSDEWKAFVRRLQCRCEDPRCPSCGMREGSGPGGVIAAHLRSNAGMGIKPDDFLVYPLTNSIHTTFHNKEQPGVELQLQWVTHALRAGFQAGVLQVNEPTYDIDW